MEGNITLNKIFDNIIELKCDCCRKSLWQNNSYSGVFTELSRDNNGKKEIVDYYCACKGNCDKTLQKSFNEQNLYLGGWEDLANLSISNFYLQHIIVLINQLQDKDQNQV